MSLSPAVAVWLLFAAAGVSAVVAALAWRRRDRPAAIALTVAMVAEAWWALGYGLELLAPTLESSLLWANLQWFGSVWVPVAWFVFALEYAGYDRHVNARTIFGLAVVPTVATVLVWTNGAHGLVRIDPRVVEVGSLVVLEQGFGPVFWLTVVYSYGLALLGSGLFASLLVRSPSLFGTQVLAILVAAVTPALGNVLYVSGLLPWPWFDPTPLTFAVSGVAGVYVIRAERLFKTTSVSNTLARASVVGEMTDGVVVVNAAGQVVDFNRAAARLLDVADIVGRQAAEVVPGFVEPSSEDVSRSVVADAGQAGRRLDVRVSPLHDHHERVVGAVVVLRDVTDERHREQQLAVLNRALRHNIRNEVSVIRGFVDLYERGDVDDDHLTAVVGEHADRVLDMAEKARQAETILGTAADAREPVEVRALVERTVSAVRESHPDVTVAVDLPTAPASAGWLLEPVLENLVENAAEHNDDADAHVAVSVVADTDTVTVVVADNGPGLPDVEAAVLEERHETPTKHGQGIGLWVVTWATDRLGGTLHHEHRDGGGTVVEVTVPRVDGE